MFLCLYFSIAKFHACWLIESYDVDLSQISVSGISAGGYMAVQFHVSYSKSIMGAAVFAGGMY
jgi:poly(3-hydroxybutyrate) depolymerase